MKSLKMLVSATLLVTSAISSAMTIPSDLITEELVQVKGTEAFDREAVLQLERYRVDLGNAETVAGSVCEVLRSLNRMDTSFEVVASKRGSKEVVIVNFPVDHWVLLYEYSNNVEVFKSSLARCQEVLL